MRIRQSLLLNLLLLGLALAGPAQSQDEEPEKRNLVLDDYGEYSLPGAPIISPNGRQIAYTHEGQIFVVASADAEPRPVTSSETSAWAPRWTAK